MKNMIYVGPLEREGERVCACCKLFVKHCACQHDSRYDNLDCGKRQ